MAPFTSCLFSSFDFRVPASAADIRVCRGRHLIFFFFVRVFLSRAECVRSSRASENTDVFSPGC